MKYVYYDSVTGQVEAEFNTPKVAVQPNWKAKGLTRGVVPDGMTCGRDHKVTATKTVKGAIHIVSIVRQTNPVQPITPPVFRLSESTQEQFNLEVARRLGIEAV